MKQIALVLVLIPFLAFAGKKERDYSNKELKEAVGQATTAFKEHCGCSVKVVTEKLDDMPALEQGREMARHLSDPLKEYCNDAASKAAICKMKTLKIVTGPKTEFKWDGSTGTAFTDKHSYVNLEMMTKEMDK